MRKIIILSLLLLGCTSNEKKIQKALNVIETNPDARQRAAALLDKWYPKESDTIVTHDTTKQIVELPGKVIRVETHSICKGFSYDTTIKGLTIYADSNGLVISGTLESNIIRDTKTVTDLKRLNRLYDSVQRYIRIVAAARQETMDVRESLGVSRKETMKWIWYFVGAIAAIVLSNVLWLKGGSILKLIKP